MCQNKLFLLQKRQVSCRGIYGIAHQMMYSSGDMLRDGRIDGWTDRWTEGRVDGRTDRRMDRRTNGWTDGWKN